MKDQPHERDQIRPRRFSIATRLLLVAFAIVMAGFVLESTMHIHADYTHRKEALLTRANMLADLYAVALTGPLWNFEHDIMAATLAGLDGARDVIGAKVSHPNGDIILSVGTFLENGSGAVSARREIVWRGAGNPRLIGHFEIALSTAAMDRDLGTSIITTGIIIAIFVAVIMIALYVAVRHITQPLEVLNRLMRRLAEGRRDIDVPYLKRNDEIGRVAWAVKMFRDNAEELDKLREDLELRVREQTRDLRHAMEDAETANQAKSEFLSSMSHELRTPLNAIMGFAQLLELDIGKHKDNPRYGDAVRQILSSSNQLLVLIEQVLNLSKIETGDLDVDIKTMPVAPVIRSVMASQTALADKYNIRVEAVESACSSGRVVADAALLRQALQHLLSNAIKYNRPGGRAELACKETDANHIRLIVTDTGHGIPFAKQQDLFQPFQRLGAETSVIEGTGIGLVLAKKFVDAMGGKIGYESVIGTGSTFWIELPVARNGTNETPAADEPALERKPEPGTEAIPVTASRCVLYVEDSPANAALVEQFFEVMENAPELLIAPTGEEGIEMAREHRPVVILMDVNLPGISGTEAMHHLRETPECAATPIVAVSADAMPMEVDKALAEGFDDYLTKPIKLSLLKELIEKHMNAA